MLIDPKSITKEQAEKFAELMDEDFGRFLHDYQSVPVASFANALIEAGIVSPPNFSQDAIIARLEARLLRETEKRWECESRYHNLLTGK